MPTQAISPPDAVSVSDRKRGRLNPHGRFVRALWALCLIGLLCACSTTNKLVESKATLWKVKGDHNTMYLLGSVHVLSKHAYPLKPALERAFDDANQVVFEIDLTQFTPRSFRQEFKRTALYPSGQSLSKKLSPGTIELLKSVLPDYGLTLDKVERFKPWFLAEWLSSRALEMAGFSDRLGVDFYFYHKAKAAGKPVLGLETLRDQAQIFDSFNDEENELLSGKHDFRVTCVRGNGGPTGRCLERRRCGIARPIAKSGQALRSNDTRCFVLQTKFEMDAGD